MINRESKQWRRFLSLSRFSLANIIGTTLFYIQWIVLAQQKEVDAATPTRARLPKSVKIWRSLAWESNQDQDQSK